MQKVVELGLKPETDDVEIHLTVKLFEPELRDREIVLPVQFIENGSPIGGVLTYPLDADNLRDLLNAYDFPETIL